MLLADAIAAAFVLTMLFVGAMIFSFALLDLPQQCRRRARWVLGALLLASVMIYVARAVFP